MAKVANDLETHLGEGWWRADGDRGLPGMSAARAAGERGSARGYMTRRRLPTLLLSASHEVRSQGYVVHTSCMDAKGSVILGHLMSYAQTSQRLNAAVNAARHKDAGEYKIQSFLGYKIIN